MTVYHVFANRSNVGDWLSARGIQSLLRPIRVTELLCDEPFVEETLGQLSTASSDDFIVIGGGGLFMDYFEPFWRRFDRIARHIPYCIWGVGCCDMKRSTSCPPISLIGPIVASARMCVVRDELTREFLAGYMTPQVIPCTTMNVVESRPLGRGLLHVDAFDNVGEANYERMNEIGLNIASRTCRPFSRINNLIPAGNEQALNGVLGKYTESDLILTGRLHGCIIGLAMGRKVLAVSGDHKVESFMRAAGLGEWVLGLDEIDRLPQRLEAIESQHSPSEFLDRSRSANREFASNVSAEMTAAQLSVSPSR